MKGYSQETKRKINSCFSLASLENLEKQIVDLKQQLEN